MVAEVGDRVAQRRQLPVQHRQHPRLGGVKNQVVQPVVAVHDADQAVIARLVGDVRRQPGDQLVHFGDGLGDGGNVLLAPAANLPFEVVAGLAVPSQSLFSKLHRVQGRNDAVHLVVDGASLVVAHAWERLVPQHAPLHELHDVKGPTDDGLVLAKDVHACHRHVRSVQALHDCEFAFNGMRRGQQLGNRTRLGAHHVALPGCDQFVGRVGLATLEQLDGQRPFEAGQVASEPVAQPNDVERVRASDGSGTDKVVEIVHGGTDAVGGFLVVGFNDAHQGFAVAHHETAGLDADGVLALHRLEFLVDPLARSA